MNELKCVYSIKNELLLCYYEQWIAVWKIMK